MKMTRRTAMAGMGASAAMLWGLTEGYAATQGRAFELVAAQDRKRILVAAGSYLSEDPVTVTAFTAAKSPGNRHDFYSQADYFWPDPKNPDGPYIERDGQSNPDNFNEHRKAMVNLSVWMPALTAAWLITKDAKFGKRAGDHLRAWFVTPETRMNPNLEFSQGVIGRSTGRNFGIIDTLHLVEVARAASFLNPTVFSEEDQQGVRRWFTEYLHWLKTSKKGTQERDTLNNHATCWALQASEYARLIDDESTRDEIRKWFKDTLLVNQLGKDGSFPKELARTKPYSYSIFNFDVMAGLAQSLVPGQPDLRTYVSPDGRGLCQAAAFLFPYLKNKSGWPYAKDVEHFDSLPVRSPGLLFAGLACKQQQYIELWKRLDPDPTDREIIRNFPIRQPLLWV